MGWIAGIADYASIISFFVSIVVFFYSRSIKQKVQEFDEFYIFSMDKSVIAHELNSLINYDNKNGEYRVDSKTISSIVKSVRKLQNYLQYMSQSDIQALEKIQLLINNKPLDKPLDKPQKEDLMNAIHSIIGFLETDHRTKYNKAQ